MKYPCSAYNKIGGIIYFARMLDKIRLKAAGELPVEYHKNMGVGLFDAACCQFLRVTYEAVVERVLKGGADAEILEWCFKKGRNPNDEEIPIWNAYMAKKGFRDDFTERLHQLKAESGFSKRDEIQTLFDYYEFDEGRAR